jgi:hypothetical protein
MKKTPFVLLVFLALSACLAKTSTQLLAGPCDGIKDGNSIMDVDGETEMCLIVPTDMPFQTWRWSADGSTLAFALHDPTITRPAGLGKFPGHPLTIHWYVMERNGRSATELTTAYNQGLSLSPDGKYVVVDHLCSADTTVCHDIYQTRNQKKVCSYKTYTVWFGDSDCSELNLKNGDVWDIKYEVNKSGCEYFQRSGWDTPSCDGTEPVTLTPFPTVTPIPFEEW